MITFPLPHSHHFMPTSSSSLHLSHLQPRPTTTRFTSLAATGPTMRSQQQPKKVVGNGHLDKKVVRYKECQKNHAASVGGHAVDGCREFMAAGEEGTTAALKCAACECHRSFHKREVVCDCESNSTSPR